MRRAALASQLAVDSLLHHSFPGPDQSTGDNWERAASDHLTGRAIGTLPYLTSLLVARGANLPHTDQSTGRILVLVQKLTSLLVAYFGVANRA